MTGYARDVMRAPALLSLGFAIAACGSHPAEPADPATPPTPAGASAPADAAASDGPVLVGVALQVTPADAMVAIDDDDRGTASSLPVVVPLAPGIHQLVITRDGYTPYRVEFAVSDKTERFTVELVRAPAR